jgi:D-arabinose 5-phosphate isomerase GutQ
MGELLQPVKTSAVYLVAPVNAPAERPPSPPSPPNFALPDALDTCTSPLTTSLSQLPPTVTSVPNSEHRAGEVSARLETAVHVIATEAAALRALAELYASAEEARAAFSRTVTTIVRSISEPSRGKVIFSGVGKSGIIAKKLAATFTSLSIPSISLHPTEALHGDIGIISSKDLLLLLTFSGATPELMALLPHIRPEVEVIAISGHMSAPGSGVCQLQTIRPSMIILPAPVHELERVSFGTAAPMTSTTTAMAVGDALALVVGQETCQRGTLHATGRLASIFQRNHPGGSIGAAANAILSERVTRTVRDIAVTWSTIPLVGGEAKTTRASVLALDVLRCAYASPTGWARTAQGMIFAPSRIRRLSSACLLRPAHELTHFGVQQSDMASLPANCQPPAARAWAERFAEEKAKNAAKPNESFDDLAIAVLDDDAMICGVLELSQLRCAK